MLQSNTLAMLQKLRDESATYAEGWERYMSGRPFVATDMQTKIGQRNFAIGYLEALHLFGEKVDGSQVAAEIHLLVNGREDIVNYLADNK